MADNNSPVDAVTTSVVDKIEERVGNAVEVLLGETDATPALADVDTKGDKVGHKVAEVIHGIVDHLPFVGKKDDAAPADDTQVMNVQDKLSAGVPEPPAVQPPE